MCPDNEEERAYHPDIKEPPKGSLSCFKDQLRVCGADCMAFQLEKPEGVDYRGQWANCMILTNEHKSAKHLVIIAKGVDSILKREQDRVRTSQTPPSITLPTPFNTRNP